MHGQSFNFTYYFILIVFYLRTYLIKISYLHISALSKSQVTLHLVGRSPPSPGMIKVKVDADHYWPTGSVLLWGCSFGYFC